MRTAHGQVAPQMVRSLLFSSPLARDSYLGNSGQIPSAIQQQSARLMCLNLPQEVTDDVLAVLFQQYVSGSRGSSGHADAACQIPRFPLGIGRAITDTKRKWTESKDGVCYVRLTRLGIRCKRGPRWLHTEEGMGDVCFVYLALYFQLYSYRSAVARRSTFNLRPVTLHTIYMHEVGMLIIRRCY